MGVRGAPAPLPTYPMSTANRKAGFTLIEIIAVVAIIALVASLAVSMTAGTGRAKLKAVALDIAALLRHERSGAILTGRVRQVFLDGDHRVLMGEEGNVVTIPRDVVLDVLSTDAVLTGRHSVARFDPTGASSGAVLKLSRERMQYEIRVNWYTGGVAIVAP